GSFVSGVSQGRDGCPSGFCRALACFACVGCGNRLIDCSVTGGGVPIRGTGLRWGACCVAALAGLCRTDRNGQQCGLDGGLWGGASSAGAPVYLRGLYRGDGSMVFARLAGGHGAVSTDFYPGVLDSDWRLAD